MTWNRSRFNVVCIVIICSILIGIIGVRTGVLFAGAFLIGVSLCGVGLTIWFSSPRLVISYLAMVLGSVLIWFSTVTWEHRGCMCGHCDFARNTGEFCVAGYGLFEVELSHTPEEIFSIKAAIGRDLGRPCQHDNGMFEWVHVRYYGLITEQIIKPGGMVAIARGGWYDEYGRERLLQWGAKDPALAETYYRKVYVEGDRDYLLTFVKSLSER